MPTLSTLIVEDGTGITNANSYVSVDDVRLYCLNRGITLPVDDNLLLPMIFVAMDYLESNGPWKGDLVSIDQALTFPRINYLDERGTLVVTGIVPTKIKSAVCQLVIYINNGVDLNPIQTGNFVVKEKIGPIETEYSERLRVSGKPNLDVIENMLYEFISLVKPKKGFKGMLNMIRI